MQTSERLADPSVLISDAAVLLGVSRRTVYYWIGQQRLETVRTRGGSQRVLLSSIARMLRAARGLPPLEALDPGNRPTLEESPREPVKAPDAGA